MSDREWFVSYDVTARNIVLQHVGDDEHTVAAKEAVELCDELQAALGAYYEHRALLGEDDE